MSGNRRSEDAGEVPWPALVDLLTSVLITFMFFVLVVTVAMSTMTMKTAKLAQEQKKTQESQNKDDADTTTPTDETADPQGNPYSVSSSKKPPLENVNDPTQGELLEKTRALEQENAQLKSQLSAITNSFAKSEKIDLDTQPNRLTLVFGRNEAGMVPAAQQAIKDLLQKGIQTINGPINVKITASQPPGLGFSQSRERALTRAMLVRNELLNHKVAPGRITLGYAPAGEKQKNSEDWVSIELSTRNDANDQ